jgi:hypothetical protein
MLHRAEFVEHIGEDNILPHVGAALERAAAPHRKSARQSA